MISLDFNWQTYLQLNPDLGKAGITTRIGAINHWKNHGVYEHRPYKVPSDFNWQTYLKLNHDLGKAGITTRVGAIEHFKNYGINENRKYRSLMLKNIKENDYKIIKHNINEHFYENVIILASHYKHYTDYVLKNIFNNLINYILNNSKSLVILVYSTTEENDLADKYKKNINSNDYVIVRDIKNNQYDLGKYCIGYKTLKFLNISSEKYHLMNDSFICSNKCELMVKKWRDNFRHLDFVGALHSRELKEHFQSWWLIMNDKCLDTYINELLRYDNNDNNWDIYLQFINLNEVNLGNKLMKIFKSGFLYEGGIYFKDNLFFDNDKLYHQRIKEGLNIIKIKRIQNNDKLYHQRIKEGLNIIKIKKIQNNPNRPLISFIHKKEYLDIFT